jgi:hypothetical protein
VFALTAAAGALLDDLVTQPALVPTSFGCHEGTLDSWFDAGAAHWNNPLSLSVHNKNRRSRASELIGIYKHGKIPQHILLVNMKVFRV